MREIKFRAWDGKEMHYDVCINHKQEAIKYGYRSTDWLEKAKAGVPLEYTEIKDVANNGIYEGDIVRTLHGHTGQVFKRLGCWFVENGKELGYYNDRVYIIGNIYEGEIK